ncbi:MAG TPA: cytochrome c [Terriglobales bacterium]|nr:cytochrome c [Terriglobales bacterium]
MSAALVFVIAGCDVERRKSDAELGLNAQQSAGRRVYDRHCERCHEAYSSKDLQGPSLKHLYRKSYLPSGAPANDDRVSEAIKYGHGKMPGFGQVLTQQQVDDLLAYLHTL